MMSNKDETGLTPVEKIKANAELVIRVIGEDVGVELNYDAQSVKWVDGYIERQRIAGNPTLVPRLVSVLGSFVGECIRREFGGEWQQIDGQWSIVLRPNNAVFPINKVAKQFKDGANSGESVYGFYQTIPVVFFNRPGLPDLPDKADDATKSDPQSE